MRDAAEDGCKVVGLIGDAEPGAQVDDFVRSVVEAVLTRRELADADLDAVRAAGRVLAGRQVPVGDAVSLYAAATRQAWAEAQPEIDSPAAFDVLLRAIEVTMPVLVEGYLTARRQLLRQEESVRREFVDDLLRGDADPSTMAQRAEPFGLDLARDHQVVLAEPRDPMDLSDRDEARFERSVIDLFGDRDVLVTTKGGALVAIVPGVQGVDPLDVDRPAERVHAALAEWGGARRWRVAVGRPYTGTYGIPRSYEESREALLLASVIDDDLDVVHHRHVLIYRVVGRDRVAITDLVLSVLTPLRQARGGAEPLLDTLAAYFASGDVATVTARRLHLSVRTVTYRLDRIADLTGYDCADAHQRFILQVAVMGAQILGWPQSARSAGSGGLGPEGP